MNNVVLIGRLTRNPEVRYTNETPPRAVATFTLAIDKNGKDKGADFPRITCFGKTAELVEQFISKGRLVGIQGRIQTGSYKDKDGKTVYTTDVVADRVEFLDRAQKSDIPEGFQEVDEDYNPDDDVPF
jgi:single-strand DNA-binding protein